MALFTEHLLFFGCLETVQVKWKPQIQHNLQSIQTVWTDETDRLTYDDDNDNNNEDDDDDDDGDYDDD